MTDWLDVLAGLRAAGTPAVLVTVVAARGSTSREAGAKMVVTAEGHVGTIGGGRLEYDAAAEARVLISARAAEPVLREIPLGPALGQCCGGAADLLFEPFVPAALPLYLYGAGHVGRTLVDVLAGLPVAVTWIDAREDQFPTATPANVRVLASAMPEAEADESPEDACHLVMTHSHDLDQRIVEAVLRRGRFRWLGLIGSATKRARFESRLRARGLDPFPLVCPVGVPGIADKHPRAIAVAVAEQLLMLRHRA